MKNPLGQVRFVHLFKVTVLNLHVIMMKPDNFSSQTTGANVFLAILVELLCLLLLWNLSARKQ